MCHSSAHIIAYRPQRPKIIVVILLFMSGSSGSVSLGNLHVSSFNKEKRTHSTRSLIV